MQNILLTDLCNRFASPDDNRFAFHAQIFIGDEGRGIMRLASQVAHMIGIGFGIIAMRKPLATGHNIIEARLRHIVSDLAVCAGKWQAWRR